MEIKATIGDTTFICRGELEAYFQPFREATIGTNYPFTSPFGQQRMIYADWTASGRLYKPIEQKIIEELGPYVANTHTESNIASTKITLAYKQAKEIIKHHVNAGQDDILIMEGSGMTGAINKLQRLLGLRVPEQLKSYIQLPEDKRPIIFITHMEHHSNMLSWMETIGDVVTIRPTANGDVDIDHLQELLQQYAHRPLKIGAFTACSNVTGIQTPYHTLAKVMHEHGGICFIDFAASAPYVSINMHPDDPLEQLDGIYFSPHKFLGGPGSAGVLIFNARLYKNRIPDHPGGGTVLWTNPWGEYQYVDDIESREDGGTPPFLQTIKAALAIKLKEKMGVDRILQREKELATLLLSHMKRIPGVRILEGKREDRLGIVSFIIEGMHYNLVVKVLNDRFGIQVRGGCSCAGPYGHYLLNIDQATSHEIMKQVKAGNLLYKPGWVRISVHPIMTNEEIYEIVRAIRLITRHKGEWKQEYMYDQTKNEFYHHQDDRDVRQLFAL
ncbi:aminotransferase class V-fold PLP-dependent enzyme [Thermaerobacillus caldiproteolyticus]|uniref:Selenocysteine lyase/cysteine desulfurase n=1 Tax=Thermaerobacillus caldiproteolyticus TaxID=247480 RepID=A0A7V9Z850_9BACL|nr:aminotransferase class V-fold PLP-dependent enzyme [Anoxybacillus caldiproteolyticus]MBA2875812.1 selenocysteine lyase/cysteine desulfurase [Anoxybacillus caldiproteolyticus]QPA32523.1 aminotransferase class V-fold PLP-dependent enzyme [Anoxybacillus caldiproteolyticus]